ncbi:hypothetical protein ACFW95_20805 [Streptomyces sp. NPDC059474]|uniref:hypothetical protein n=1 Tax=unclassified Streptomyces TaxID=2593676 RepID=UPI0033C9CA73
MAVARLLADGTRADMSLTLLDRRPGTARELGRGTARPPPVSAAGRPNVVALTALRRSLGHLAGILGLAAPDAMPEP